ncbi:hypothetical protein ACOJUR_12115 [Alicyclobacillus tolerans]|uniref:hypothetical protein n=1 Tax=Alicyclobacillus tolerans TaxID=90970 RepID=UPI003B7896EB
MPKLNSENALAEEKSTSALFMNLDDYLNQKERKHAPIESLSAFGRYCYQNGIWRNTGADWEKVYQNFLNSIPE